MGILSFLFGKKEKNAPSVPEPTSRPVLEASRPPFITVKIRKKLKDAFNASFRLHIASLGCFSMEEIEEMVSFISNVQYGFVNKDAWHLPIYEKYFKPREWSWPLLEEWRETLIARRAYWSLAWFPCYKDDDRAFDTVVRKLKVDELRSILKQAGVPFESKAEKAALIDLLKGSVASEFLENESNEWKKAINAVMEEEKEKNIDFKAEEYRMLVSHIETHAKNIEALQSIAELDASYELSFFGRDGMQALAKELHERDPLAIPPFFPDDRTSIHIIFTQYG